jgi:hypothetical protein
MNYSLQRCWAMLLLLIVTSLQITAQTQIRIKPFATSDDAEQDAVTGTMYLTSSDLELGGYDWQGNFKQITGIRFPSVNLPQGAVISRAFIQFSVDEIYANTANTAVIAIKAQKGDAATYNFTNNNILSRIYTTAQVNWATTAWNVNDQRLAAQQTPDIKNLITEAIQTGWKTGNALAFSFSTASNGYATAWSIERSGQAVQAPELVIEYTVNTPLSISASVPSGTYTTPFNLVLNKIGSGASTASIRYTTDGSIPTATTGLVYSTPISINQSTIVNAIAVSGATVSAVATYNYIVQDIIPNGKTIRMKITSGSDDAEETIPSGVMTLASSDLESGGYDYGNRLTQIVGVRFPNVVLPFNAIITRAYIQFAAKESSQFPLATINIKAQTLTNAPSFTTTSKDISSRTYSDATTTWATQPWTINDRSVLQQSADIKNLINEAISKGGWRDNMALAFSLSSPIPGWANAWSVEGTTVGAPELVIEYTDAPAGNNLLSNVFINEASGSSSVSNKSDFIEIFNNNTTPVVLTDVYLTDDKSNPFVYNFNGQSLTAKSFLTVNADGDIPVSTATTAAFGISATAETIYLMQRLNGVVYLLDSLILGATTFNTSYGRFPDADSKVIPFALNTQGASNNNAKELFNIGFSVPRGLYTSAFNLTIQAPVGATIRYTTDNTKPTATNGTVYTGPLSISANTVLRAYAFTNAGESKVITQTYVFPNTVSQQLALSPTAVETALKELPIVSISATETSILSDTEEREIRYPCTFEYINKFGDNKSSFVDAGYNIFGNASLDKPKKSLRFYFKSEYGYSKFKHKIFERQVNETYNPTDEFDQLDLRAGNDAFFNNNLSEYLSHGLLRKMGSKDVHVRFVNVFINGTYWGVFPLREKFDNNYAASYYGAQDTDYDYLKTQDVQFNWPQDNQVFVDPDEGSLAQYQEVLSARTARNYQDLKKKVDVTHLTNSLLMFMAGSAEPEYKAIIGKNFSTPMTFYMKDMDAYMDDLNVGYYNQLFQLNITNNIKGPHSLLGMSGLGGETSNLEYQTLLRDRIQLVYLENTGAMTVDSINAFYRRGENIIRNSIPLEIARWNAYNFNSWNFRNNVTVEGMANRIAQVISKFRQYNLAHTLSAVTLSKASGNVNVGEKVFISNPNANTTVYYTLDGTDVVLENALSPTALLYNATTGVDLPLGKVKLRARAFSTGNFGMYADAEYVVSRPVKITAIAYQPNPIAPAPDVATNEVYEFFYLTNGGASAIDISNFMVTEAIDTFRFPAGTSIAGGETIMMCADNARYPSVNLRKFKWIKGKLANGGENISFRDATGNLVNEVKYDTLAPWPYAKGNGFYLRLKSISADNSKGGNWEAISLTDLNPSDFIQNVESFRATPQTTSVVLDWTNPTIAFDEIVIVAKEGTGFLTKPNAGAVYSADANFLGGGTSFESGKVVFSGVSGTSVTVTNLTRGKIYYFRAYIRKGAIFTEGVETTASMPAVCQATGQLLREIWDNVTGVCVSDIPVFTVPTASAVQNLPIFQSPKSIGDNFGVRYRGYICPPETGNYTFYIASDNGGELWLSTDDNVANKRRIAFMPSCNWANAQEWTKYAEQKSVVIALVAGQKYYIEALHKEGDGGDVVSVGWQKPSTPTVIEVMPGSILAPFSVPLSLVSNLVFQVEGYQEGQKAVINWVSNANKKADYYIVEKKVGDTPNFEPFQYINAQYALENNALHHYTLADNAPEKGKITYRVAMILDGRPPQYSDPISLDFSHFSDFVVYPNPATEKVIVDLSNVLNLPTKVSLTDFMGRTIVQTSFDKAPNTVSLDLSSITVGQYFIRIQTTGKREVMKKLAIIR